MSSILQIKRQSALHTQLGATIGAVYQSLSIPSFLVSGVPSAVLLQFDQSATNAQKATAQSMADGWDWSQAAQDAYEDSQDPDRANLLNSAAQAVSNNDAFLAIANPTNQQLITQLQKVTQQNTAMIKVLIKLVKRS